MAEQPTEPSIVVGVDGSRAGERAAQWAVEEALGRELPLRLVAAAEHAGDVAAAEAALRSAVAALGPAGPPVRVDASVAVGDPAPVLLDASRRAAMICVGATGLAHSERPRVGSTAAALVASAHCPVAVVRAAQHPAQAGPGWVVVELDQSPDSAAVLQYAVGEARMRRAPLRVLGTWQSGEHGAADVADAGRVVRAQLDRNLENWRRRYPDLEVAPVAVHGSGLGYLAEHAPAIQLVILGAHNTAAIGELLGPAGLAALHGTGCSLLVLDSQRLL